MYYVFIFSQIFLKKTIAFFSFAIKIIFPLGKSPNPLDTYIIVFCLYVYRIFEFIHSLHESSHLLHSKYFELSQRFSTLLTIKNIITVKLYVLKSQNPNCMTRCLLFNTQSLRPS